MSNSSILVLIPTYNRPKFLQEGLDSVLCQTHENYRIIISDDSDNEETKNLIASKYADNPKVSYFYNPEITNMDDNWRFLKKRIPLDVDYVQWLMDDDLFYPTKFEIMANYLDDNPGATLVTSLRDGVDINRNIVRTLKPMYPNPTKVSGKDLGKKMLITEDNYIGEPTTPLLRRTALDTTDIGWSMDEGEYMVGDFIRWLDLMDKGEVILLPEAYSAMRFHFDQDSQQRETWLRLRFAWLLALRYAWEEKIFLSSAEDFIEAASNWLKITLGTLRNLDRENYQSEKFTILKKVTLRVREALYNGNRLVIDDLLFPKGRVVLPKSYLADKKS